MTMINFLRMAAIITLNLLVEVLGMARFRHLWHYCVGRGGWVDVGEHFTPDIVATLLQQEPLWIERTVRGDIVAKIPWWDTTLFEGAGFWGRPELFYLIGCFTAEIQITPDGMVRIMGEDVYDWHPTPEGNWHTSSFPDRWWLKLGAKVMEQLGFGHWFVAKGWPMGAAGISNRLWADMEAVGAKPFTSTWDFVTEGERDLYEEWNEILLEEEEQEEREEQEWAYYDSIYARYE